jgi:hypothetical protein
MMDNFEKFIQENRESFDALEPGANVWNKVEKNLKKKKSIPIRTIIYRAAAVALIFVVSYMFSTYMIKNDLKLTGIFKKQQVVIPELQEAEVYYAGLIDNKLEEIKPFLNADPNLEDELLLELSELDSIYKNMKEDLKDNIANQEVIEAMIQNYRLRVSILEDILSEFKETEDDFNDKFPTQKTNDSIRNELNI